ncbi:MAG: Nif3-like dinuclear metal center hexameric protein [Ruminococcaceae bacterium]|nr:Nif3-like dinuclear metal center hexameric protein [Oscillospiraceae bacterium]
MSKVLDIYNFLNQNIPFETQEEWDNSGLLVGNFNVEVSKIAVCLDVTHDTLSKAIEFGADLIVSHHPVIWDPLKSISFETPVSRAISNGISIISAHTNWDVASGGVNDILAKRAGLKNVRPELDGMVRVGELDSEINSKEYAKALAKVLNDENNSNTGVRISEEKQIKSVAVCGGSGGSFLPELLPLKVDALLTGDAKHSDFIFARDNGIVLIAAGHYETETIAMPVLLEKIKVSFPEIEFMYIESNPIEYI